MEPIILKYAALAMTFGSGFTLVGYENYARQRGWPVGEMFSSGAPFIQIFAFFCMLSPLAISLTAFPWWSPFIVAALGFLSGLFLSQVLKSWIQVPALLGAVIGFILCPLLIL